MKSPWELSNIQKPNIEFSIKNYDDINALERQEMVEEEDRQRRVLKEGKNIEKDVHKKVAESEKREEAVKEDSHKKDTEDKCQMSDKIKTFSNDMSEKCIDKITEVSQKTNDVIIKHLDYTDGIINNNFKITNDGIQNNQDEINKRFDYLNGEMINIKKKLNTAKTYIIGFDLVIVVLLLFISITLIAMPISTKREINNVLPNETDSIEKSIDSNIEKINYNNTMSSEQAEKNN